MLKDNIKMFRKKIKLTQEDLAKEMNVSRSVIAKWETGIVVPRDDQIDDLCQILNIKKSQLIKENSHKKNNLKILIIILSLVVILLLIILIIIFC